MIEQTTKQYKILKSVAYIALVFSSLLYAGNVITARLLSADIPPVAFATLRGLLGLLILLPLSRNLLRQSLKPSRQDYYRFAILGFLGITVAYITFLWGMKYTTATNASIIFATYPAISNTLLAFGWGIKPSARQVLGIGLSFLGLLLVFTQGSYARLITFNLSSSDLVLLVNVLSISLFAIIGQGVMTKFSPLVTCVYSLLFGTIFLLPYGIWEILSIGWHFSLTDWLLLFYMGCMVTGIAIYLSFEGISRIGTGKAAIFSNMIPIFSIILAVVFLGERLAIYHLVGFILVLAGIVFSILPGKLSRLL